MKKSRRKFSAEFKTNVALEAIKERGSLSQLAMRFELNPNQISQWKREFLDNASKAFGATIQAEEPEKETKELYQQIGQLKVENDFLKKSLKKIGL